MAQAKSGAKGFEMEETLRNYFRQSGYFVVRGVPYRLDGEDVTDVDLWLYERPVASTRRRLLVDIKNKRHPKAAERIIWAKGLQSALGIDGSIVATTDQRPATRRLARNLGVSLLDGDAIAELTKDGLLNLNDTISSVDFDITVKRVDDSHRSDEWRRRLQDARASLIAGIGVQSANICLNQFRYFAEQATIAHPDSEPANVATRLTYLMSSLALVSFDYVLSDFTFHSVEARRIAVTDSIRYGQSQAVPAISTIWTAIALARRYAENGAAVAKQIQLSFFDEAEQIPAEIIADYLVRFAGTPVIFDTACILESASSARVLPSFDHLATEEKSALGIFLDFNRVSRERFAKSWSGIAIPRNVNSHKQVSSLFVNSQSTVDHDVSNNI